MAILLTIIRNILVISLFSRYYAVQSAIRQTSACSAACNKATYCSSGGTCISIPFAPVVKTKRKPASKKKTAFHLVIFSDVQYYFLICKQNPLSECIYDGFTGPRPRRRGLLDAAAARQASCAKKLSSDLKDVKAILNNGDITNRGLPSEVDKIREFHDGVFKENGMPPLVVALGNHDYFLGDNEGSVRTIAYFEITIRDLGDRVKLRNIDYDTTDVIFNAEINRKEKYSKGSMAFSIEWNRYVFVILHWSTALRSGVYTNKFEGFDSQNDAYHFIDVTPVTNWLIGELAHAKKKKRKVILIPHGWKGLRLFTETVSGMTNILRDSSVIAVISGHVHDAYGLDNMWTIGKDGEEGQRKIPVYYAGSASYEKMISVEMKAKKRGISVKVYDTKTEPCFETKETSTQFD